MLMSVLILFACKDKTFKIPEVVPLDHLAVITQEFIYEIKDAPTPECHASTVEVSNGTVVASWFGGTKEKNKDVGIWVSRRSGSGW